jgi:hypothetical protein
MANRPKINEQQLLLLLGQPGMTHDKIADIMHVSRSAVTRAVKRVRDNNPTVFNDMDLQKWAEEEPDRWAAARLTLMNIVEAVLPNINPKQIGIGNLHQIINTMGNMIEKERLLRGQSTDNVAHMHVHAYKDLDAEAIKLITSYTNALTEKKIENSRTESLSSGDSDTDE